MGTFISILLIVIAVIACIIIIPKMRSDGKKLGNEETDAAERMGRELDPVDPATIPFEKVTLGVALDKAWEAFENQRTDDIIELDTDTTGCQLSMNNEEETPRVMVEYVFKTDLSRLKVPDYIREKYDGDILTLWYMWPEEKVLLIDQIQEVLGGTIDSYVRYHYWDA